MSLLVPVALLSTLVLIVVLASPTRHHVAVRAHHQDVRSHDVAFTGPRDGAWLGAYVQPSLGDSFRAIQRAVNGFEREIGRPLAIDQHYYRWDSPFPGSAESWDISKNRIPMISWGVESTSDIVSGSQDGLIRERAIAVRALGHPVFIRWFAEMDAASLAQSAGSPSLYVQAWQHIHTVFQQVGAGNAVWIWCPQASSFASGDAQLFYPGDRYVDWVCADGFSWAPLQPGGSPGGQWVGFEDIFHDFYAWAVTRSKPIMIGETGAQEGATGQKATWIHQMQEVLSSTFPSINALVYFDAVSSSREGGSFDWRIESSPSSLEAFRNLAAAAHFNPAPT